MPDGTPLASSPLAECMGCRSGPPGLQTASVVREGGRISWRVTERLKPRITLSGNVFLLEFGYDATTAVGRRAAASAPAPQAW